MMSWLNSEVIGQVLDYLLCGGLLAFLLWILYKRKKRIPDRFRRYFPVVVAGVCYVVVAVFMTLQLSLGFGWHTILAILAGLNNNIFLLLLAAICYHKWPNIWMKLVYFGTYLFTCWSMVLDAAYFWQTSMHIESVVFQNLNIYALKGVLATTDIKLSIGGCLLLLIFIPLFRVTKPQRHKPNFVWSLFCVAAFTLVLNLATMALSASGLYIVEHFIGTYAEVEAEKTRDEYRRMIAKPMNVNLVSKALWDTDKLAGNYRMEVRQLTEADRVALGQLGIPLEYKSSKLEKPAYDKIVLLVLESVHRDFINFYNPAIPEEATPFLNSLLIHYPHMDNFYTSSVPTTQGLNALFRSHLILDKDIPGKDTPSLYRSVQDAGMRGIFMNASSQYYSNELKEYPEHYGMREYYAKEYLEKQGYTGASGWGFHNDVMYEETLRMLERGKHDRMLLVTKTLDMHQPYPYTGINWNSMPVAVRNQEYATIRGMYWVDKTLQHFFEEAERLGLMDERTLFIITSDHNPHSGGEYTKLVARKEDKMSVAPLPLIFISKNLAPLNDLRTSEYCSQIDVAPTLLYLLGLDKPSLFMGRSLLEPCSQPYALGYFGGKAYFWSEQMSFVDQMDKPVPDSKYEDALSNYIVHFYTRWHQEN